jgi:mRNA-degrading endonuclease toxin of MazEF toxin-antitoxin module
MTSKNHKRLQRFYVPIKESEKYNIQTSNAILNQIKPIDKKRFI